ncbi:sigma-70 family RNA polymerase sigma factor [Pareuzebyella sediminis]|uniref:sigma-70 family RNA polymerase sigma factor n=1 Tax=Pareuzebyella sediminis TaxID=2607998 RepID=UPI0011ED7563|nr:sigma-70 family RNA polymerase sigma factor [Pareuzebyella sediminis]
MRNKFVAIIKENEGIIYKVTKIYTDQYADQQDLYQEIVYQLWKSFDSFNGKSKISTWIYKVALNTSLMHIKRKTKHPKPITIPDILLKTEDKKDTLMDDRIALLYKQIKKLNEGEKAIIFLFLEGKKHKEIAAITGFTTSNVGTQISRIKQKLKTEINNK